ncbi:MAG: hypothetical protein JO307_17390 [Bryobacterales bacterium]|nr:hypothetical protein [Bryobacterales bacterium]
MFIVDGEVHCRAFTQLLAGDKSIGRKEQIDNFFGQPRRNSAPPPRGLGRM